MCAPQGCRTTTPRAPGWPIMRPAIGDWPKETPPIPEHIRGRKDSFTNIGRGIEQAAPRGSRTSPRPFLLGRPRPATNPPLPAGAGGFVVVLRCAALQHTAALQDPSPPRRRGGGRGWDHLPQYNAQKQKPTPEGGRGVRASRPIVKASLPWQGCFFSRGGAPWAYDRTRATAVEPARIVLALDGAAPDRRYHVAGLPERRAVRHEHGGETHGAYNRTDREA